MSPPAGPAMAASQKVPRARKSIAHMPSPDRITPEMDKENMTLDAGKIGASKEAELQQGKPSRKSRSKSLGPGGLEALRDGSGNRRKSAVPSVVKSILKPTIPLSPLRDIPSRGSRKGVESQDEPKNSQIPDTQTTNSVYPSTKSQNVEPGSVSHPSPSNDPFSIAKPDHVPATKVSLRTEEEQQAAVREREDREKRELEKKEILERRDARRKSMANRRVSFAPEATLHTWDVVEYFQDSTTSSASTNSSRRASTMSAGSMGGSPHPARHSPASEVDPPSTPPEQVESPAPRTSPAHQRDLHQKKRRRRSSGIPPMNFNNPEDFSSSPYSGSSSAGSDETENHDNDSASESLSGSEEDDDVGDTAMSMDIDDTSNSIASARSGSTTSSSGRLDEALRQAAQQAGTRGIEYDEHGDMTMEIADDEVTASFKPWVKKGPAELAALQDQENLNPFSPAFKAASLKNIDTQRDLPDQERDDMSMDITRAVGGIIPTQPSKVKASDRRKSVASGRRRSSVSRRHSSGEGSSFGDETMDLTQAIGGIQGGVDHAADEDEVNRDEEMTMEFTSVIGGVLGPATKEQGSQGLSEASGQTEQNRGQGDESDDEEVEMDVTRAVGGILPRQGQDMTTELEDDETMGMDITTAIGGILPKQLSTGNRSQAKALMEMETDAGQLASSPFQETVLTVSPAKIMASHGLAAVASDTGSPSLATIRRASGAQRRASGRPSTTPKSTPKDVLKETSTPVKKPSTPSKQATPQAGRPTTPGKTPPSKNITFRSASPKKLFQKEIKEKSPKTTTPNKLFQHDPLSGLATPRIVLTPRPRRSSGVGIDREGLGSPRIVALLDRRTSIGEQAVEFSPGNRGIRFENPQTLQAEVEKEREEDERRESGRAILESEADIQDEDKDATINLKEMIQSLTPKKKVKGRKSLHVGAAKGLLGKRPIELDEDDDEPESIKKLKGREGSPVKTVKLQAPPSKEETTGRSAKNRSNLREIAGNTNVITPTIGVSPLRGNTTPKGQGRFKNVEIAGTAKKSDSDSREEMTVGAEEEEDKIHLQDFLNLTSIRFMELNTTKRRHTVAPNAAHESTIQLRGDNSQKGNNEGVDAVGDLERCVVAGASTIPMLELYQHSCHELKKYISEGRSVVREIEAETYEQNPPLFREYISAPPDVKFIMDNQFKNVKTNARLISKGMWYEWRLKLLDGLKEGLVKIGEGMDEDEAIQATQEAILQPLIPSLIARHNELQTEKNCLQQQADELANCDQTELEDARQNLIATEAELARKKELLQQLQQQLTEKETFIEAATERKKECAEEIKEAERVREECRGWTAAEVGTLEGNVNNLEHTHGWMITFAASTTLTMTFQRTLQLFFDTASFAHTGSSKQRKPQGTNSPISLTYVGTMPLTTERRFFLQIMQAHIQCLSQREITVPALLSFISTTWILAGRVATELETLNRRFITDPVILADNMLAVRTRVILPAQKTKIEVVWEVVAEVRGMRVQTSVDVRPKVVYGSGRGLRGWNEEKMRELVRGDGRQGLEGEELGSWAIAVEDLLERIGAGRGSVPRH